MCISTYTSDYMAAVFAGDLGHRMIVLCGCFSADYAGHVYHVAALFYLDCG